MMPLESEKFPARSSAVGTVPTWLLKLSARFVVKLKLNVVFARRNSLGTMRGPPIWKLNLSLA